MRIDGARDQYIRWLLLTKDLSPHTLRAYEGDTAAFERHLGARSRVSAIDKDRIVAFIEKERAARSLPHIRSPARLWGLGAFAGGCSLVIYFSQTRGSILKYPSRAHASCPVCCAHMSLRAY